MPEPYDAYEFIIRAKEARDKAISARDAATDPDMKADMQKAVELFDAMHDNFLHARDAVTIEDYDHWVLHGKAAGYDAICHFLDLLDKYK